ncbi:hypothetical protein FB451DRAFT_1536701 [Mycena latifolia]|nr:hypothetical protein FB451DRAFT_1536701 [Mycena latifolia]
MGKSCAALRARRCLARLCAAVRPHLTLLYLAPPYALYHPLQLACLSLTRLALAPPADVRVWLYLPPLYACTLRGCMRLAPHAAARLAGLARCTPEAQPLPTSAAYSSLPLLARLRLTQLYSGAPIVRDLFKSAHLVPVLPTAPAPAPAAVVRLHLAQPLEPRLAYGRLYLRLARLRLVGTPPALARATVPRATPLAPACPSHAAVRSAPMQGLHGARIDSDAGLPCLHLPLSCLSTFVAQLYFAYYIFICVYASLINTLRSFVCDTAQAEAPYPLAIAFISTAAFSAGIAQFILASIACVFPRISGLNYVDKLRKIKLFKDLPSTSQWATDIQAGLSLTADIMITAGLSWRVSGSKTGIQSSNTTLNSLITMAINPGFLTKPGTFYFLFVLLISGKSPLHQPDFECRLNTRAHTEAGNTNRLTTGHIAPLAHNGSSSDQVVNVEKDLEVVSSISSDEQSRRVLPPPLPAARRPRGRPWATMLVTCGGTRHLSLAELSPCTPPSTSYKRHLDPSVVVHASQNLEGVFSDCRPFIRPSAPLQESAQVRTVITQSALHLLCISVIPSAAPRASASFADTGVEMGPVTRPPPFCLVATAAADSRSPTYIAVDSVSTLDIIPCTPVPSARYLSSACTTSGVAHTFQQLVLGSSSYEELRNLGSAAGTTN